jgi:hypothetical protein
MPAQTKRNSMLSTRSLILFLVCYGYLSVADSQDDAIDNATAEQQDSQKVEDRALDSDQKEPQDDGSDKSEEQQKTKEVVKKKPPKQVFKPTEEISEDKPVPFPVDI